MNRKVTTHQVNECNSSLAIEVLDDPGAGGANHHYGIYGMHTASNDSAIEAGKADETCVHLFFQNGPVPENGTNGVTHEALLAIVKDRLEGFQSGPYACADNAEALGNINAAIECLQRRTRARMARGVEGTHKV